MVYRSTEEEPDVRRIQPVGTHDPRGAGPPGGIDPEMAEPFRHEALLYANDDEFVDGTLAFVGEGIEAGEPVFIATSADKIALLEQRIEGHAGNVRFADMHQIGVNPGAIISAWREFVSEREPGQRLWGIGEPVWPGRSEAELAECHRHECLLNLAFADTPDFHLLCPYDASALPEDVLERVGVSHPVIVDGEAEIESDRYRGLTGMEAMLAGPLPEPEVTPEEFPFVAESLPSLRYLVSKTATDAGASGRLAEDLVLAVNELATNSVRHAEGTGTLRFWREGDLLVWEVHDRGRISNPLAGRERPPRDDEGGYGLWMVNQLAELVQVRSSESGTVVRLHVRPR